jgi:Ca2+-binding EF-hand superfamily protein
MKAFALASKFDSSKVAVLEILEQYASDNGGVIDFDDFMAIYSISISRQASKESLMKIFAVMDQEHEQALSAGVLLDLARRVKLPLTKEQAALILEMHGDTDAQVLGWQQLAKAVNPAALEGPKSRR